MKKINYFDKLTNEQKSLFINELEKAYGNFQVENIDIKTTPLFMTYNELNYFEYSLMKLNETSILVKPLIGKYLLNKYAS